MLTSLTLESLLLEKRNQSDMNRLSFIISLLVVATASAFAPSTTTNQHQFQRARLISGSTTFRPQARFMSKEDEKSEANDSKAPQGTFYDDEVGSVVA